MKLFLITLLFLLSHLAQAIVLPPEVRCIQSNVAGQVTVIWIPPVDPLNEFVEYRISYSQNINGPYLTQTLAGIVNNSFTINTSNANPVYVFVQSIYDPLNPQASVSSDTLSTIIPNLSNVTDTTAHVQWTPFLWPLLPTANANYDVKRAIGIGSPFFTIGTFSSAMQNPLYQDDFKLCSDSVYYQIELQDASGCISISNPAQELAQDVYAPVIPNFDSVSVDSLTDHPLLGWNPSTSSDTRGYLIYYRDPFSGQWVFIDTVMGRLNTSFMDTMVSARSQYQQYAVAAFDSCLNPNTNLPNISATGTEYRTIEAQLLPNLCEATLTIEWNKYVNWTTLASYNIWVREDSGAYYLAGAVDTSINSFTLDNIDSETEYCIKIQAYDSVENRTSTSTIYCIAFNNIIAPDPHYIREATVNGRAVEVTVFTDVSFPFGFYALERALNPDGVFFEVDRESEPADSLFTLFDPSAFVKEHGYSYRVTVFDTCGQPMFSSNLGTSIHLKAAMDEDNSVVSLNWNRYADWRFTGVEKYELWRSFNGVIENNPLTVTGDTSFIDTLDLAIDKGSPICYYVLAYENSGNPYGFKAISRSNNDCVTSNPKLYIPNAFTPNGANPIFKPVIIWQNQSEYLLQIFNRYGELLFESSNYEIGWDGTVNGAPAPGGVYVYKIQYANALREPAFEIGSVALIR